MEQIGKRPKGAELFEMLTAIVAGGCASSKLMRWPRHWVNEQACHTENLVKY